MTFKSTLFPVIVLCLFLSAGVMPGHAGSEVLVLVDAGNQDILQMLEDLQVPVYYSSDGLILAGPEPGHQAILKSPSVRILDYNPWSGKSLYYWVIVRGTERVNLKLCQGIEILYSAEGRVLIKATPAAAEQLPQHGFEIARINRVQKPYLKPAGAFEMPIDSRDFGGVIDTMVAAVSQVQYTFLIQALENFVTRYTYTTGVDNAADWIYNTFQGYGLTVERHYFSISSYTKQNIIATKTGTVYPDEVVFIVGHYDSISEDPYNSAPGADDNASGTAAVMVVASVLADYDFERTIKFACFAGEEQGLVGSEAYVQDIFNAGMNVVGCFNFDMIAWSGSDTLPPDLIIYTDSGSTALANTLRDAALYYLPSDLEPIIIHEALSASDHASFWQYGYDAICGIEEEAWGSDFNPYYHTTSDLVSNCDLTYATNCTKAAIAAVADYAVPAVGLVVTPSTDLESTGPEGGPFSPDHIVYTLENKEDTSINYQVTSSEPWVTITNGSGTLAGLATTDVTVTINSNANGLSSGLHTDTVNFVNLTSHDGDTTRDVNLGVGWQVFYLFTMDTNPGWTTEGQWAHGTPTGGGGEYGGPDPTSGYTGTNVYGYNLNGDYPNNLAQTHLTSTALDCTGLTGLELTFQRWLNVEQPIYDHAYLRVSNNGTSWTTIWENTSTITDSSWNEMTYDISAIADNQSTVYLRWTMGSTDGGWRYSGWNIDDVTIAGFGDSTNNDPVLTSPVVTPDSGYYGTRFEYNVHYYDEDGDAPTVIQVNIDGTDYGMTLDSGTADNGTYRYLTRDIDVGVAHTYYFHAEDGLGGSDRNPDAGTLSGPDTFDPELYLSGTPGVGAWMTIEVWGAVDALWAAAWSSQNGPHYVPVTGLFWDLGPGDLHMAKKITADPVHLDTYGYGTYDFKLPNNLSSGTKYIQGGTKMNAFWGQTNFVAFIIP